jgi:hypothetical protein
MTTSTQAAPPASAALATTTPVSMEHINTSASKPDAVTVMLRRAAETCHLVSPSTSCGQLAEGCAVQTSAVLVTERDTYEIPGGEGDGGPKRGLGKVALYKIASAAGISWDPRASHRTDDGRDPNYVEYVAVGTYRSFDGSPVTIMGTKAVDLRPKSPVVEALFDRYRAKHARWEAGGKKGYSPKDPTAQIREQRLHILSLAETKARLRAVRALGIRTAYTSKELEKPFVVAKLCFTGQTSDPVLRREFALMQASRMLGGMRSLYGDDAVAPHARLMPAPPVEETVLDDDEVDGSVLASREGAMPRTVDMTAPAPSDPSPAAAQDESAKPAPSDAQPAAKPAPSTSGAAPRQIPDAEVEREDRLAPREREATDGGAVMKFGRSQGQRLCDVDDEDLGWYANALQKSVDDPSKARWRASNERDLAAARAEQAARRDSEA